MRKTQSVRCLWPLCGGFFVFLAMPWCVYGQSITVNKKIDQRKIMHKKAKMLKTKHLYQPGVSKFEVKPGVPKGFETMSLSTVHRNYISVYYHGRLILNTKAQFDAKTLKFQSPKDIIPKIPNLNDADKPIVLQALNTTFKNDPARLCHPFDGTFVCNPPKPKVITVVFDANLFKAELFINPKFILLKQQSAFKIYPSTSGFSYLAQNNMITTGATGNNYNNSTSLLTRNIVAYRNHELQATVNLTHSIVKDRQSTNQLDINNLTYSTVFSKHKLSAGMFSSVGGDDFIYSQNLLGLSLTNHGFFFDPTLAHGTEIPIYLTSRSKVDIYKKDTLIYSQYYSAGKTRIDTTSLPEGAYNIKVVITGQAGNITTFTRFFSKQSKLPQDGKIYYQADLGFISTQNTLNQQSPTQVTFPAFTKTLLIGAKAARMLTQNISLQGILQSNFDQWWESSLNAQLFYAHLTISPGLVVGSSRTYGFHAAMSLHYQTLSFTLDAKRIYSANDQKDNTNNVLLLQPGYNFSSNLDFNFYKTSFHLGTQIYHYGGANTSPQYNASVSHSFFLSDNTALTTILSGTRSYQDSSITFSLAFTFNVPDIYQFSGGITLAGQSYMDHTDARENNTQLNSGFNLNKGWQLSKDNQNELNTNVAYDKNNNGRTFQLSSYYSENSIPIANAAITYNIFPGSNYSGSPSSSSLDYNASTNFSYIKTDSESVLTPAFTLAEGVLVNVKAPKDTTYDVIIDHSRFSGVANHANLIPVSAYMPHEISLVHTGRGIYDYDKRPREVNLYEGNVQALHYVMEKQFILFAQVVDSKHHGINNLVIENLPGFNQTDSGGYFQVNLTKSIKQLAFRSINNTACVIKLPKIMAKGGLAVVDKPFVCHLKASVKKLKTSMV